MPRTQLKERSKEGWNAEVATRTSLPFPALRSVPRLIRDEQGDLKEVALAATDYEALVRFLAATVPWEDLPPAWQDAVDHLMVQDRQTEPTISWEEYLARRSQQ